MKVKKIAPITESRNQLIREKSDLAKFVEKPLLAACEHLYDKNIRTYSTSANKKDLKAGAYIIIDYDTLSPGNKGIAKKHSSPVEYDSGNAVKISFQINEDDEASDLEKKSLEVVDNFKKQKALWIPHYSFDDVVSWVYPGKVPKDHGLEIGNLLKQFNLFHDKNKDRFYHSKEHFEKVNDS